MYVYVNIPELEAHSCRYTLRELNRNQDETNNYLLPTNTLPHLQLLELYSHHQLNNRQSSQMLCLCDEVDLRLVAPVMLPNQVHLH